MAILALVIALVAALAFISYHRAPGWLWTAAIAVFLGGLSAIAGFSSTTTAIVFVVFAVPAAVLTPPPLRRVVISNRILAVFRRIMPPMSPTEAEANNACTGW